MTAAPPLPLVDFILARIAEDEERHREYHRAAPRLEKAEFSRVLRECDAKRRIVELHHALSRCAPEVAPRDSGVGVSAQILFMLAAVYADHPDYRPEWRPHG